MSDRPVLEPTAAHPITVEPTGAHVTVSVNGEVVAETDNALTLQESTYPAVQYIPRGDVVASVLRESDTQTYCPYKGEASYYHVVTKGGDTVEDAIWTYEAPYPAVAAIAGHLAFYPDKAVVSVA
ncbi:hypothetical protein BST36_26745 [Mycolicibacterium moriokaense]|jgi:uncharacterized protein (DUF427 family)|uniref:DUF427 domain-containing protein n=1 Tax=Mycolicibacterium moriokaense TaxID=39691 RepID=A0AAD1H6J2_9MYCO|nr:DUF427 domain-containing protein [Mycolicibacterium moriokaense]MCV7039582.1 DUF427 domain-containing protein [Mycolicibacterium moriokaense]ORB15828.1 hypothetical protein BST36_26745 [Mycolicibacterium moriokaense]BBW99772.1 hypothetical protein MMOR_07090 [Mycolicibacterium moriokaense]